MTGRGIKRRETWRETREEAGAGFKVGSSPRSKSRFSRQTFSTGQRFALFRFLSFFLSFPFLSSLNR